MAAVLQEETGSLIQAKPGGGRNDMFKLKTNTRELIIRDGEEEGYFDLCCGILLGIGAETQLAKTPQGKLPPIEPPQEESTPEKESCLL